MKIRDHKDDKTKLPIDERHQVISMISANLSNLGDAQKRVVLENLKEVTAGLNEIESLKFISSITQYISKDNSFTDDFIVAPHKTLSTMDFDRYVGHKYVNRFIADDREKLFKILGNITQLQDEGFKPHQVNLVIFELERNRNFRMKFISQPVEAAEEIGIKPW